MALQLDISETCLTINTSLDPTIQSKFRASVRKAAFSRSATSFQNDFLARVETIIAASDFPQGGPQPTRQYFPASGEEAIERGIAKITSANWANAYVI